MNEDHVTIFESIFNEVKDVSTGEVADYIPQLSKYSKNLFGLSVCSVKGKRANFGDTEIEFCMQSCSKPLTYCAVREQKTGDLHEVVGYEPSGQSFNAYTLNKNKKPHNPLINTGAIATASLYLPECEQSERFESIMQFYNSMAGDCTKTADKVGFNNSVCLSEKAHADRNISLAYYMKEHKVFGKKIDHYTIMNHLNLYFECCSISITCRIGSVIAATLANGGICPTSGKKIMSPDTVRDCLSLMYNCGMYDYSGQFSFKVGLPAKSGVSGCILLIIPGQYGVCIYSPPLNEEGNSVRGVIVCEKISESLKVHIFDNIVKDTLKH